MQRPGGGRGPISDGVADASLECGRAHQAARLAPLRAGEEFPPGAEEGRGRLRQGEGLYDGDVQAREESLSGDYRRHREGRGRPRK